MSENANSMKPLSEVASRMVSTLTAAGTTANTPALGSMQGAGQMIIPALPAINYKQGLAEAKAQATAIRYLVRRAQPSVRYTIEKRENAKGWPEYFRVPTATPAELTDSERAQFENVTKPASKEIIVLLLSRLAMHKRMAVDPQQQTVLFMDYADLLFGIPEYALASAVLDLIENDKGKWFPQVAELTDSAKGYMVKPADLSEQRI